MSGSSLDGLDIAHCSIFQDENNTWHYTIEEAETLDYSDIWQTRLQNLAQQNAETLAQTHMYYGLYCGELIQSFIQKNSITQLDFIAFHGHTIFHNPARLYTLQIGSGAAIAAKTGIDTICDFRSTDVALKGEGAPLAPIVDAMLFSSIRCFLNIGGICNISINNSSKNIGFDVCAGNQLLNYLAQQKNMPYDDNGKLARKGNLNEQLLYEMGTWDFLHKPFPKSLDRADIEPFFMPLLNKMDSSIEDKLHTVCVHIAQHIAQAIDDNIIPFGIKPNDKLLISGGGAFNSFLIEKIQEYCKIEIFIPDEKTIQFKESLLMSLLGTMRILQQENCLKSVTGAIRNSISGAIYKG